MVTGMQFELRGNPDYGQLHATLAAGERLRAESGAMSWMSAGLEARSRVLGGILPALARKFLGGESFFVGEYGGSSGGTLALSPAVPGTVLHRRMDGGSFHLTAGCFLACGDGLSLSTRFGGLRAFFNREGAFFLDVSGTGDLFFHAYGAVHEKTVDGELVVDTGHLVAWEPTLDYEIRGMGGFKSTFLSGEGLTMRFRGRGKLWVQTRYLASTAGWLTPFCVG